MEVPLQWRNQLWPSLEEGCRTVRLSAWECPFSGVTSHGSLEEECQKVRFGAWECSFYKALQHQSDLHWYTSPPPLSSPTATTKHAVTVCACTYVCYKQLTHNSRQSPLEFFHFFHHFVLCSTYSKHVIVPLYTDTHSLFLSLKNTPYIIHTAIPHSLCTTYTEHVHIPHHYTHLLEQKNDCMC